MTLPNLRYAIIRHEDRWVVTVDGKHDEPYETLEEAVEFAVNAAHVLGGRGLEVDVVVNDGNKTTQVNWTSVPPPPKGPLLVMSSRRGPRSP